jgi:hypothetical protein
VLRTASLTKKAASRPAMLGIHLENIIYYANYCSFVMVECIFYFMVPSSKIKWGSVGEREGVEWVVREGVGGGGGGGGGRGGGGGGGGGPKGDRM